MNTRLTTYIAVAAILSATSLVPVHGETTAVQTKTVQSTPVKSGRIEAHGINYYYEIHGKGEPLLLLHGGLGSIQMFGPVLPILARHRQVIGIDLQGHAAIAPKPEEFPKLLDRMGAAMRQPYNWSGDVKKLTMPVMLVYGDSDMVRPEHIVEFYQLLGGGLKDAGWMREHMSRNRLAILPDLTHYEIFLAPELATTVLPFLDGKSGSRNWAEQVTGKK